jgi:hypothetical protein
MNSAIPDRLELQKRMYVRSRSRRRLGWILGVAIGALTVLVAVIVYWKLSALGLNWDDFFRHVRKDLEKKWFHAGLNSLMLLALLLQAIYMFRAKRHERLILTREGISYRSPMPGFLQAIQPGWSLRWDQIRSASLTVMPMRVGPQGPVLALKGHGKQRKIAPLLWVNPVQFAETSPLREWRRLIGARPYTIDAAIDETPVMQYIAKAAPDLRIERGENVAGMSFALERSPRALAVVVAFFVFAAYAMIDGLFLRSEVYASAPFYLVYFLLAIVVGVIAGRWLRNNSVPMLESTVLAVMLGLAAGAAAYPGALRVNALTDTAGFQTYEYVRTADGSYRPPQPDLPRLILSGYPEYWGRFAEGSIYRFQLRKGGLGFYQLNMGPVRIAMRQYYLRHSG